MWRARTTFIAGRRVVAAGQLLADDDPVVRGREHLCDRVDQDRRARRRRRRAPDDAISGGADAANNA